MDRYHGRERDTGMRGREYGRDRGSGDWRRERDIGMGEPDFDYGRDRGMRGRDYGMMGEGGDRRAGPRRGPDEGGDARGYARGPEVEGYGYGRDHDDDLAGEGGYYSRPGQPPGAGEYDRDYETGGGYNREGGRNHGMRGRDYGMGRRDRNYGSYGTGNPERDHGLRGRDYGRDFDYGRKQGEAPATTTWSYTEVWRIPGPYSGIGPKGYERSSETLFEEVCERLMRHGQVDAGNIEVNVDDDEVTLTGTVSSRREKRMAEDAAESVLGVRDVHNRLRIQEVQARSQEGGQTVRHGEEPV